MNLIESVWNLSGEVVSDLRYVKIYPYYIDRCSQNIKNWLETTSMDSWKTLSSIQSIDEQLKIIKEMILQYQQNPDEETFLQILKRVNRMVGDIFLYELIGNSINYCYWYGGSDLRPNGSSSTKMYKLLNDSFNEVEEKSTKKTFSSQQRIEELIDTFCQKLILERFPLLEDRTKHLKELYEESVYISCIWSSIEAKEEQSIEEWMKILIKFPGYVKDPFLKRAILFIFQIYRRTGLFKDEISKLPIPADYQVPKILRYFGCIEYYPDLLKRIREGTLILEGSREEIEIRAASIVACSMLAEKAGCTCEQVDSFLWSKRNKCTDNFHLTVSSNY